MDGMRFELGEYDQVAVTQNATGLRWTFDVLRDGSNRRHLDWPMGPTRETLAGASMRSICLFAQEEALHAGRIDY
ncbi:hypothetical protein [Lichenibacterium dinghuense]|uniref:hypothetical protein n=1 Tax=Lichenibacterium dinghuense TaxID=2895977 RepID=UPI001F2A4D74|nr:hypothetical protein [Lichenibacterium sp. 6Y81]